MELEKQLAENEYLTGAAYLEGFTQQRLVQKQPLPAPRAEPDALYASRLLPPMRSGEALAWLAQAHCHSTNDVSRLDCSTPDIVQRMYRHNFEHRQHHADRVQQNELKKHAKLEELVLRSGKTREEELPSTIEKILTLSLGLLKGLIATSQPDETRTNQLVDFCSSLNDIIGSSHESQPLFGSKLQELIEGLITSLSEYLVSRKALLKQTQMRTLIKSLMKLSLCVGLPSLILGVFSFLVSNNLTTSSYHDKDDYSFYPPRFTHFRTKQLTTRPLEPSTDYKIKTETYVVCDQARLLFFTDRDVAITAKTSVDSKLQVLGECNINSGANDPFYALGNLWFSQYSEVGPFSIQSRGYSRHWYFSYQKNDRISSSKSDPRLNDIRNDYNGFAQSVMIYLDKYLIRVNLLKHNNKPVHEHHIITISKYELSSSKYGYSNVLSEHGVHSENKLVTQVFTKIDQKTEKVNADIVGEHIIMYNRSGEYVLFDLHTAQMLEKGTHNNSFMINGIDPFHRRVYSLTQGQVKWAEYSLFKTFDLPPPTSLTANSASSSQPASSNPELLQQFGIIEQDESFDEEEEEKKATVQTDASNAAAPDTKAEDTAKSSKSVVRFLRYVSAMLFMNETHDESNFFSKPHMYEANMKVFTAISVCIAAVNGIQDDSKSVCSLYVLDILLNLLKRVEALQDRIKGNLKIVNQETLSAIFRHMKNMAVQPEHSTDFNSLYNQASVYLFSLHRNFLPLLGKEDMKRLAVYATNNSVVITPEEFDRLAPILHQACKKNGEFKAVLHEELKKGAEEVLCVENGLLGGFYGDKGKNRPQEAEIKTAGSNIQSILRHAEVLTDFVEVDRLYLELLPSVQKNIKCLGSTGPKSRTNGWSREHVRDLEIMIYWTMTVNLWMMIYNHYPDRSVVEGLLSETVQALSGLRHINYREGSSKEAVCNIVIDKSEFDTQKYHVVRKNLDRKQPAHCKLLIEASQISKQPGDDDYELNNRCYKLDELKIHLFSSNGGGAPQYHGILTGQAKWIMEGATDIALVYVKEKLDVSPQIPSINIYEFRDAEEKVYNRILTKMNHLSYSTLAVKYKAVFARLTEVVAKHAPTRIRLLNSLKPLDMAALRGIITNKEQVLALLDGLDPSLADGAYQMLLDDFSINDQLTDMFSNLSRIAVGVKDYIMNLASLLTTLYDNVPSAAIKYVNSNDHRFVTDSLAPQHQLMTHLFSAAINKNSVSFDESQEEEEIQYAALRCFSKIVRYSTHLALDASKVFTFKLFNKELCNKKEALDCVLSLVHTSNESFHLQAIQYITKLLGGLTAQLEERHQLAAAQQSTLHQIAYIMAHPNLQPDHIDFSSLVDNPTYSNAAPYLGVPDEFESELQAAYKAVRLIAVLMYRLPASSIPVQSLVKYVNSNIFGEVKAYALFIITHLLDQIEVHDTVCSQQNLVDIAAQQLVALYEVTRDSEGDLKEQPLAVTYLRLYRKMLQVGKFADLARAKLKEMVESLNPLKVRIVLDILSNAHEVILPGDIVVQDNDLLKRKLVVVGHPCSPIAQGLCDEYLDYSGDLREDKPLREKNLDHFYYGKLVVKPLKLDVPAIVIAETKLQNATPDRRIDSSTAEQVIEQINLLQLIPAVVDRKLERPIAAQLISLLETTDCKKFATSIQELSEERLINPQHRELRKRILRDIFEARPAKSEQSPQQAAQTGDEKPEAEIKLSDLNLGALFSSPQDQLRKKLIKGIISNQLLDLQDSAFADVRRFVAVEQDKPYSKLDVSGYSQWVCVYPGGSHLLSVTPERDYYVGVSEEKRTPDPRSLSSKVDKPEFKLEELTTLSHPVKEAETGAAVETASFRTSLVLLVPSVYTLPQEELETLKTATEKGWSKLLELLTKLVDQNAAVLNSLSDRAQCNKLAKKLGKNGDLLLSILSELSNSLWYDQNCEMQERKEGLIFELTNDLMTSSLLTTFAMRVDEMVSGKLKNRSRVFFSLIERESEQTQALIRTFSAAIKASVEQSGILAETAPYLLPDQRKACLKFSHYSKRETEQLYMLGMYLAFCFKTDIESDLDLSNYIVEGLSQPKLHLDWKSYQEVDPAEFQRLDTIFKQSSIPAEPDRFIRLFDGSKETFEAGECAPGEEASLKAKFAAWAKKLLLFQLEEPLAVLRQGFDSFLHADERDCSFSVRLRNVVKPGGRVQQQQFEDCRRIRRLLFDWHLTTPGPVSNSAGSPGVQAPIAAPQPANGGIPNPPVPPLVNPPAAPANPPAAPEEESVSIGGLFD